MQIRPESDRNDFGVRWVRSLREENYGETDDVRRGGVDGDGVRSFTPGSKLPGDPGADSSGTERTCG